MECFQKAMNHKTRYEQMYKIKLVNETETRNSLHFSDALKDANKLLLLIN